MEHDSGDVRAIGVLIKALREARGWTPARLSRMSGVSQTYIGQIEKGTRPKLGVEIVLALARALRVQSMDEITGYDFNALPPEHGKSFAPDDRLARLESSQVALEAGLSKLAASLHQLVEIQTSAHGSKVRALEQGPGAKASPRAAASPRGRSRKKR